MRSRHFVQVNLLVATTQPAQIVLHRVLCASVRDVACTSPPLERGVTGVQMLMGTGM